MPQLTQFNALMPVEAFQAGRDQRNTRLAGEAQNALLQGDREGAMRLAQRTGDAGVLSGLQEQIAQMDEQQRQQGLQNVRATRAAIRGLVQVDEANRPAWIQQNAQTIQQLGLDPAQVAQMPLTNENLMALDRTMQAYDDELYRSISEPYTLGANETRVDPLTGQQIVGQAGIETRGLREQELEVQRENAQTARIRANQPRGPLVTVNGPQQPDPFQNRMAEAEADQFASFIEVGTAANRNLVQIGRLEQLLDESPQGFGGAARLFLGDLGINTEGLTEAQAARALINQLVPQQRPAGSGPMSDADLALFMQSLPRIINQPGGNARIIETIRQINEYDATLGRIAQQAAMGPENGGISRQQARAAVNAMNNPLEWVRRSGQPQAETTDNEVSDEELFRILSGQ